MTSTAGFVVIAKSKQGTLWIAGPDGDKRHSEIDAKKLLLALTKSNPEHFYSVKWVGADKSALEGER